MGFIKVRSNSDVVSVVKSPSKVDSAGRVGYDIVEGRGGIYTARVAGGEERKADSLSGFFLHYLYHHISIGVLKPRCIREACLSFFGDAAKCIRVFHPVSRIENLLMFSLP